MKSIPLHKSCADPSYVAELAARNIVYSSKNTIAAKETFRSAGERRDWNCLTCGHSFDAQCSDLKKGMGCAYCSAKRLCSAEECDRCLKNSIASPQYQLELSHRKLLYSVTNPIGARQTFIQCNKKRKWDCLSCKHTFEAYVSNVAAGNGCPFPSCCSHNARLCDDTDCSVCRDASVAASKCQIGLRNRNLTYSESNSITARQTSEGSSEMRLWTCLTCLHTFEARCNSVTGGGGCPFSPCCVHPRRLCADVDCLHCLKASVANPDYESMLLERQMVYSRNNVVFARNTFRACRDKRNWECLSCGQQFNAECRHVGKDVGSGCPYCVHKTERRVREYIQTLWCVGDRNPSWLRQPSGRQLFLDIAICGTDGAIKVIVEVDGEQHFAAIDYFDGKGGSLQRKRDTYKDLLAHRRGISTIRICQEDVWNQWPCWQTALRQAIEQVLAKGPTQLYLSRDPARYDAHKLDMTHAITTNDAAWPDDEKAHKRKRDDS